MKTEKQHLLKKDGISYVVPFILITSCFALWGFANDITNPMVKAFSKIFRMSVTDGALVQVAFYGGYFAMAFPAAIFIRKYSYKAGVLMGLLLYAVGAFMFFRPSTQAAIIRSCWPTSYLPAACRSLRRAATLTYCRWAPKRRLQGALILPSRSIPSGRCWACM